MTLIMIALFDFNHYIFSDCYWQGTQFLKNAFSWEFPLAG